MAQENTQSIVSRAANTLAAIPAELKQRQPAEPAKGNFVGDGGNMTMADWHKLSSGEKYARLGCPG